MLAIKLSKSNVSCCRFDLTETFSSDVEFDDWVDMDGNDFCAEDAIGRVNKNQKHLVSHASCLPFSDDRFPLPAIRMCREYRAFSGV